MHALVHAAEIQDRDGGALVMATLFGAFPFLLKLFAHGGYQGPEFRKAVDRVIVGVNVEIVKRSDQAKGFVVLRGAGSSRGHSPGSAAVAGSRRIGNATHARRSPSSASPQSTSCSENSVNQRSLFGLTLKTDHVCCRRRQKAPATLLRIIRHAARLNIGYNNPRILPKAKPTSSPYLRSTFAESSPLTSMKTKISDSYAFLIKIGG